MPDHAGSKRWDSLLQYFGPDSTRTGPDGSLWTSKKSRAKICPATWTAHPADSALGTLACDEYAMASTHESGGYPGGVHEVTGGEKCAQLYTDKMADGSTNFGLHADTHIAAAKNGPTWTERCGRASIPATQNSGAFHKYPAPAWRLLDKDGFFLSNPGFEHCTGAETTCAWRKVRPEALN